MTWLVLALIVLSLGALATAGIVHERDDETYPTEPLPVLPESELSATHPFGEPA